MDSDALKSARLVITGSLEDIEDQLYRNGATDGLPIVPPTPERVARMIEHNGLDPQAAIAAKVAPQNGEATVEKIAINAVMAGCRPEHLPVVIAAVEAMTAEGFDLFGVQATTHPCGMIVFVNGPIAKELEINSGSGAMGPGWRANATIGRAVRLVMLNLGGAHPGSVDKSTQGTPAKYTYCFAENEEASPWEPFHVSRGFAASDSTVTVLGLEGPHDINGQDATKASSFLKILSNAIVSPGSSNFRFTTGSDLWISLGPEHAAILGRDGVTRRQVQEYLFEHSRVPIDRVSEEHIAHRLKTPAQYGEWDGSSPIPVVKAPENFLINVVGGAGLHSSWMPSWGGPRHQAVTKAIRASGPKAEHYDLLIVGQGYAGMIASKLAAERGLRTANFEAECMGGLIMNLNELDPAPQGAEHAGFELASNLAMQNMEQGVVPVSDAAVSVERRGKLWLVKTRSETYAAPDVVVATGARLKKLGVANEEELFGQGVSECADCDGPMFMDMQTVVVGGGDSAFQEALALSQYAAKVTMVMRGSGPTARAELQERAAAEPKIVRLTGSQVLAIEGEPGKGVTGVRISTDGHGEQALACSGVFVFIGLEPNTAFLPAELERDASGALVVSDNGATSLPGLWAIGAVRAGFGGLLSDAAADAERAIAALTGTLAES
jgi:thioredoxin reductase